MAIEKILSTRILNKIDTLENWSKSSLKIKNGEICLATVAASAGTGLTEPVVMAKIGTAEEKTFAELPWSFYAKASDVLEAAKDENKLKTFINGVIADAGIATSEAMEVLAGRVTKLEGDEDTDGSVAKAIKEAIDALADVYVAIKDGKSLVDDEEITKLSGVSEGANKVEASENGKIKIDGVDTVVYTHPDKHAIDDVTGLQDALDGKQAAGDYAAEVHTHIASEVTDFATEVAKVKVDEAVKATQDGNGKVIADTYAEKATTLAGYSINDAYTKDEVDNEIEDAINTFVSAYITSDGDAIDKLQEIANWIDNDKDGAADIIADVEANAGAIAKEIEDRIAADALKVDLTTYNEHLTEQSAIDEEQNKKIAALEAKPGLEKVGTVTSVSAGEGLFGGVTEGAASGTISLSETTIASLAKADTALQAADIENLATKDEVEEVANNLTNLTNGAVKDNTDAIAEINETLDGYGSVVTCNKADFATYEQGILAQSALQRVWTTENGGLKVTYNGQIDIDENIVFVFDCGNSTEA